MQCTIFITNGFPNRRLDAVALSALSGPNKLDAAFCDLSLNRIFRDVSMLQNRTWIDRNAEAEFWKQMERIEVLSARIATLGQIGGLLKGGLFRRASLQRDMDAIRNRAQDLIDRHTVPVEIVRAPAHHVQAATIPASASDPLRMLAGMMVSLRQDRSSAQEDGEQSAL